MFDIFGGVEKLETSMASLVEDLNFNDTERSAWRGFGNDS